MPEQTHFEGPRIFEPLGKGKESATEPHSEFSVRPPQPRGRPTGGGTADRFGNWFDPHRTDRFRMPPQTHSGNVAAEWRGRNRRKLSCDDYNPAHVESGRSESFPVQGAF